MSGQSTTVAKNLSVMLVSQLITWVLALAVSIMLPRYLGAAVIGQIAFAYAIWTLMAVLIVFGMDLYLAQMVAREPARTPELVGTSLVLRVGLFALSCVPVAIYLGAVGYPADTVAITWIMGASFLFNALAGGLIAGLTGLERMEYISVANVVSKLVFTVLNLAFILLGLNVYLLTATHTLMAVVAAGIAWWALLRFYPLRLRLDWGQMRAMLVAAGPLLLFNLVVTAYQQIGKLQLSALADSAALGYLSAATTIFGALMFVPVALTTALLPVIARSYAGAPAGDHVLLRRSFDMVFLLGVPVGLGVAAVGGPTIVLFLGPEFAPASAVSTILGLALIFTYLNTTLSQFLVSMGRTGAWTLVMLVGTLVTLPLNVLLVPWGQQQLGNAAAGSALVFLITEALVLVGAVLLLPRGSFTWENVRVAALGSCAGALMLAAAWWWRDRALPMAVLTGALVYPAALLLLRAVPRHELELLRSVGQELLGKARRRVLARAGLGGR